MAQFQDFMLLVREEVVSGSIINFTASSRRPQYAQHRFETVGPNAYMVCDQLIKRFTGRDAVTLPFASYALQQNDEMGLTCSMFCSHSWEEELYELSETLCMAWPRECEGAYLCFLANPQNLDINALVECPETSPFYRILECRPLVMVMAANSNCPVHSRLWCCLEAWCAATFDIPVEIAGDPLWLVPMSERPRARAALHEAGRAQEVALVSSEDGMRGIRFAKDAVSEVRNCFESIAISVNSAECSRPKDRELILELIGDRASAVDAMIKQQMLDKSNEAIANTLCLTASSFRPNVIGARRESEYIWPHTL